MPLAELERAGTRIAYRPRGLAGMELLVDPPLEQGAAMLHRKDGEHGDERDGAHQSDRRSDRVLLGGRLGRPGFLIRFAQLGPSYSWIAHAFLPLVLGAWMYNTMLMDKRKTPALL